MLDPSPPREPWWRAQLPFLVAGICAAVGGLVFFFWPTGRGALAAAHAEIEAQRARVCPLLEQLRPHDETPDDLRETGEPLLLPGYVFIEADPTTSRVVDGSNADAIEEGTLRAICSGTPRRGSPIVSVLPSVFDDLGVSPDDRIVGHYDPDSVAIALSVMRRTRWLLVERVVHHVRSRVSGGALIPGSIDGDITVFRLEGAERFGSIRYEYEAPSDAFVYARTGATGALVLRRRRREPRLRSTHRLGVPMARRRAQDRHRALTPSTAAFTSSPARRRTRRLRSPRLTRRCRDPRRSGWR